MRASVVAMAAVLALGGCAPASHSTGNGDGPEDAGPVAESAGAGAPGLSQVRVLADEKLREAFGQIETLYEMQHPNIEVVLSYGSAVDLAERIAGGEPAEVFATEDASAMAAVTGSGKGAAETFAGGQLRIAAVGEAGAAFVAFVREGGGSRVLTDTGVLRP